MTTSHLGPSPGGVTVEPDHSASVLTRIGRGIVGNPAQVGVALVWLLLLAATIHPALFTGQDPNAQSLTDRLLPPGSRGHLLGTDQLGNDIYTRLVYGARTSVLVGFGAMLCGAVIGVTFGVVAGYFSRLGPVVEGLIDVAMTFPGLMLVLAIVAMFGHASIPILVIVLGLTGWTAYARVLTGVVRGLKEREYILASRASGSRSLSTIVRHIVPNIGTPVVVLAVVDMCRIILAEAGLSFLGLGIQAPAVSWGLMLGDGQAFIYTAWWLVVLPGALIALVVLTLNIQANIIRSKTDLAGRSLRRAN